MMSSKKNSGCRWDVRIEGRRMRPLKGIAIIVLAVSALAGCTSHDQSDLRAYVNEVKARKAGRIAPLPEVRSYESYTYNQEQLRDPFRLGKEEASVHSAGEAGGPQPDLTRNKEPLEAFPLDSLHYVGHLEQGGKIWAIITAPDGFVYRVQEGNYIGQNLGRITGITESDMQIKEIVPNGLGGWVERDATLSLSE